MNDLNQIHILLENPKYAGNIGMICRLISNFSLPPLRIVGNPISLEYEMEWMAHNASEEISRILYFDDLKSAYTDLSYLIGTKMGYSKNAEPYITISELSELYHSKNQSIGILFGREDSGLSLNSVDQCQFMMDFHLPGKQKSMNLSHAVTFIISGLFHHIHSSPIKNIAGVAQKDKFFEYTNSLFDQFELNNYMDREGLANKRFRTILDSRPLSKGDIDFLYKIFKTLQKNNSLDAMNHLNNKRIVTKDRN